MSANDEATVDDPERAIPAAAVSAGLADRAELVGPARADLADLDEPADPAELARALVIFEDTRPRLFGIAYRMLGSAAEAEEIVQEVWLRWQAYDRSVVESPAALLATICTRLAINAAQSARARHETYIGPWLPEPVDTSADPALGAERGEALEFAVLILLEKLTPTERAAYVLREAFDYAYSSIAEIVRLSEPAVRQLVSRARKHLAAERRAPATTAEQRRLLAAFLTAAQSGDLTALENLFAADVVSYSDGNGVKLAARIPIIGRTRVAKFVAAFSSHFWTGAELRWIETNGQPSVVISRDGEAYAVLAVSASEGIDQLLWMMSPPKIAAVSALRA
ncbi:sigma-70 family RNA polymerase sigma factor [Glaciihabitans sp. dw_435]|uniref:sigma-70 family RNA polymerase sigma factor n=1 Tax=Glaciihabitans sp. dw_435 TaxID=2720081 RepID=UPI001BD3A76C|nr:sigma-70 family RNA polymerase sigma factor [Glaciihabitans sp. dw_435]